MGLILPISIFGSGSSSNGVFPNAAVTKVVLDSSDNAYISGSYTTVNGMSRKYVAKILAINNSIDGNFIYNSLSTIPQDISLNSGTDLLIASGSAPVGLNINTGALTGKTYASANATLNTIFSDPDANNIFISGLFTSVSSVPRTGLAKLLSTGAFDPPFTCNLSSGHYVTCMESLGLGSTNLYLGGTFTTINGTARRGFAKVNINTGALISDLDCSLNNDVFSVHLCSNGEILIGGSFTRINATTTIKGFGRVDFLGAFASGFTQSAVAWNYVTKIVEYKSGAHFEKILVAGLEGTTHKLYRLNPTGTVDGTFGTSGSISATGIINDVVIRSDGSAVVVGAFTTFGGKNRSYYAKISASGEVL
jgi:hypothetical protein